MVSPDALYTEHDRQIWAEELAGFVPGRVFDAHIHLLNRAHLSSESDCTWDDTDLDGIRLWAERLYPGREVRFLVLGTPMKGIDVRAHNQWVAAQIETDPRSRMNRLVTPACRVDDIRRDVEELGCIGLKPYRTFSVTGDAAECRIHEFLPHEQLALADELGLWVTMHLSRFNGCADQHNLADLTEYTTQRYPRIKWILAHCARSFTYWPIREAVERLRELPNIWYDTSAVTDIRPFITLFQREDHRRIFYGSDGVDATYFRGQYAALGRSWQYLDVDRLQPPLEYPHCDGRPILAVYEQLLAVKQAAEIAELSAEAIECIFWKNAVEAFGV